MLASDGAPELGFNEPATRVCIRDRNREAVIDAERENIYKLRYVSYQRARMLQPGAPEYFMDPYDQSENGKTFGLYLESRLAASIRVHIASQRLPIAPALTVYSDYLQPLLDKSKVIVDPTDDGRRHN